MTEVAPAYEIHAGRMLFFSAELSQAGDPTPSLYLGTANTDQHQAWNDQSRMQARKFSNARSPVWLSAAMLLMLAQTVLYTLLQLRPGRLAMMPYFVGPKLLILAAGCCLAVMLVDFARKPSFRLLRDWRVWASLAALALVVLISQSAYSVYPSSYDGKPSKTCFRLPLEASPLLRVLPLGVDSISERFTYCV